MYALIAYDEDYYTFETFMGIFSTKEKAQEVADNDYWEYEDGEKVFEHQEYKIFEITLDKPFEI